MELQAFLSRRVVTPEGIRPAAVLVQGEVIRDVVTVNQVPPEAKLINFGDAAILPGLIDAHVHINDPGRTEWEGFEKAKRAAAKGRCWVDWAVWGGVVADNQQDITKLAGAGVRGFKCFLVHPGIDEFTMVTEEQLRETLPYVAETGLPLLVHAELPDCIDAATKNLQKANWTKYSTYLQSRPAESEVSAIKLLISLCRDYEFSLHIVHLSASHALPALRAARLEGLPVSVETCPHYLHFQAEVISRGATQFKCAPPIRGAENREGLWSALKDRTIDLVATDHSPCPPEMKRFAEGSFRTAWGGVPSLSVALPVMYTEARARGFSLTDIACWMAEAPAKLVGCQLQKGKIATGYDADLVVFNEASEFLVTRERLHYRHTFSPYLGEKLKGEVKATYVRGRLVFEDNAFHGKPDGRELPA
jgi:allantoinase